MGKTLTQIVADVRVDLRDTDSANYRWSDAALQRAVDRARARLQTVLPRERTAELTAQAGVREYALAGIADLLWVERVAFDAATGAYPPRWTPFEVWNGSLMLLMSAAPRGGETIRLYYAAAHVVDGTGNTLPPEVEPLLAVGAAVYAALEAGVAAIGRYGASEGTPRDWQAWLEARLAWWEGAIERLGRARAQAGLTFAGGWSEV